MISRSRAGSVASACRTASAPAPLRRRRRAASTAAILGVGDERRMALAPPQLVERRVARDPEQPRALLAAAPVEGAPAPVGALERERGDVLGRCCGRRAASQRTRTRRRGWSGRAARSAPSCDCCAPGRAWPPYLSHPHYDEASGSSRSHRQIVLKATWCRSGAPGCQNVDVVPIRLFAGALLVVVLAVVATPALGSTSVPTPNQIRARSTAPSAPSVWATINVCDTRKHPRTIGIRGEAPALGFPATISISIAVDFYSKTDKRFEPDPSATKMIKVGPVSHGIHQRGVTFRFAPHTGRLRGTATFRGRAAARCWAARSASRPRSSRRRLRRPLRLQRRDLHDQVIRCPANGPPARRTGAGRW